RRFGPVLLQGGVEAKDPATAEQGPRMLGGIDRRAFGDVPQFLPTSTFPSDQQRVAGTQSGDAVEEGAVAALPAQDGKARASVHPWRLLLADAFDIR